MGTHAHGMHDALGDPFPVEVGQLLQQVPVLEQDRAGGSGRLGVLVVGHGRAGARGEGGT